METPMLSSPEYQKIKELRTIAKWSSDSKETKAAIKELSAHGDKALQFLEEVLNVTAYNDIKAACIEAIKTIEQKPAKSEKRQVARANGLRPGIQNLE